MLHKNGLVGQFIASVRACQQGGEISNESQATAKAHLMTLLPEMIVSAKDDPRVQYYLGLAFAKGSESYLGWMYSSARKGYTDANFALGEHFLAQGKMGKAASFFTEVLRSKDSYLKDRVTGIARDSRELTIAIAQLTPSANRFFTHQQTLSPTESKNDHKSFQASNG